MNSISGWHIKRLMRKHKVTIRDIALRMNITLKRVREVRTNGVTGQCMCLDWYEGITSTGIFVSTKTTSSSNNSEGMTVPANAIGTTAHSGATAHA